MKHAILGGGNLGLDICEYTNKNIDNDVKLFTVNNGWHYSADRGNSLVRGIQIAKPDHVWVAVGAGSVEGAKKDFMPYLDLHVRLPAELLQKIPEETALHFFSTNYAAERHQSLYAESKAMMEDIIRKMNRPNTYVYRVESLYGTHRPEKTFPGRFLTRNPKPSKIDLPDNFITPTPTAWLARAVVDSIGTLTTPYHNVAPTGAVSVAEWARYVVSNPEYKINAAYRDKERPSNSKLNCTLPSVEKRTWLSLWQEHYKKEDYLWAK